MATGRSGGETLLNHYHYLELSRFYRPINLDHEDENVSSKMVKRAAKGCDPYHIIHMSEFALLNTSTIIFSKALAECRTVYNC